MWRIEFSSADFLPYLPEEAQANPGVYGFELAHWLSRELAQRGVDTSYPMGEDWGWLLEWSEPGSEVTIGCSSMTDEGGGYGDGAITWSVFVEPHKTLRSKLFGSAAPMLAPARLTDAIVAALADKGIEIRHVEP